MNFGDVLRWIVEGAVVLIVLDQAALAAERRGWIRWRHNPPRRGTITSAALHLQSVFEPAAEHAVEERSRIGAEQDEDGDPPDPVI